MNDFNVSVHLCPPIKNENGNIKFPFVTFILASQMKVTCHGCFVINFISLP